MHTHKYKGNVLYLHIIYLKGRQSNCIKKRLKINSECLELVST